MFNERAEIALEEESAIYFKNERRKRGEYTGKVAGQNCAKPRHGASRCYFKDKKEV
jgi:hypothetical protein